MKTLRGKNGWRAAAGLLLAGALAWWLAAGAHRGWTMTSVPKRVLDEVTGIEAVVYEQRLVPGVDVLAAAVGVALLMVGVSFLERKSRVTPVKT
ncbi:hypothetical protein NXS98_10080 [Fontisphaera persica]|uniref:hypothetical protein n=1 Tax=Fontisphaera persica TaxID=2974023 RepID=UPI0024C0B9E4|nr:hypothetical protein [Fontisphaera persica]WCJ58074.1 hypothetical protein NXS98_10080 [Fontisphaera persica]